MSLRHPHQALQPHRSDLSSSRAVEAVTSQPDSADASAIDRSTFRTPSEETFIRSTAPARHSNDFLKDTQPNQGGIEQEGASGDQRSKEPLGATSLPEGSPEPESTSPWARLAAQGQDHLRLFFAMHHKLFDLVAFYVVMFAINGQMTSLPTRLEWIGFCVQSIVALRRAFQTSIKHGLGLTSFLGMLDLLVGQLFLHQDRLGLLPTVANILVYFYVINLTRGLVFGDSVSCLLWFLFGLVDIYRRDSSTASIIDLTPYRVIPVHTVGFGLYILMSELVDVMLQSAESDQAQGRYLNYAGAQKQNPVSIRTSRRSMAPSSSDVSSNLRFELCITEITPYTVSFCLNALSDAPSPAESNMENSKDDALLSKTSDSVDVSSIKVSSAAGLSSGSSGSGSKSAKSTSTPKIISTSDIVIHVNYIPWREVQYHFPDEQSFTLYGLTPSTDYEIEMKVHQFSSFVTRVGTRAAPPGTTHAPSLFEKTPKLLEGSTKGQKNRKAKKNQRSQKSGQDKEAGKSKKQVGNVSDNRTASPSNEHFSLLARSELDLTVSAESCQNGMEGISEPGENGAQLCPEQILIKELQASIQASIDAANSTRATLKKLKRDQVKAEALMKQELEGIGRAQAKAAIQDQKRRQKLSFLQESIKQTDAQAASLQDEIKDLRSATLSTGPEADDLAEAIESLERQISTSESQHRSELSPIQTESEHLETETKRLEAERLSWLSKATQLQETEIAPLQLRLQRLEQQQIVWQVAAEANKEKDREVASRIAILEKKSRSKTAGSHEIEKSIQDLRDTNALIQESIDREMETWDSLDRESSELQHLSNSTLLPPLYSDDSSVHESHPWFSNSGRIGSERDVWLYPESNGLEGSISLRPSQSRTSSDLSSRSPSIPWPTASSGSVLESSKSGRARGVSVSLSEASFPEK
ncbi:hypothetical protein EMPS_09236 [Entomortierella parvispora]|uniref:Uncharacterized protein n=1 Tax=Entomortierella parvispora TaxID=205924 RepID=A0A9P3HIE5_9FUNG|nr:hypothetical protein EMPS_09236 [Entomortierella parvispora]